MGFPVAICASPSSSMIGTPAAWHCPSTPGKCARATKSAISAGGKAGMARAKSPNGAEAGAPAISQWPDGVSLPRAVSIATP